MAEAVAEAARAVVAEAVAIKERDLTTRVVATRKIRDNMSKSNLQTINQMKTKLEAPMVKVDKSRETTSKMKSTLPTKKSSKKSTKMICLSSLSKTLNLSAETTKRLWKKKWKVKNLKLKPLKRSQTTISSKL